MTSRAGTSSARSKRRSYMTKLLAVMACSACLAAAFALTSGASTRHFHARPLRRTFSVLAAARAAATQGTPSIQYPGAVSTAYAASEADGNRLFVSQQADGDICIIDQEPQSAPPGANGTLRTGAMASGCSTPTGAEQNGGILFQPASGSLPATAAVLVPDGVGEVDFSLSDGTVVKVAVANNVAWYASASLTRVTFDAPGGGEVSAATTAS